MPPFRRAVPFAAVLVLFAAVAFADEVSDKQKQAAQEKLKTAEVGKAAVAESAGLIVCGRLPETRLKAIAEALQKTYKTGRKAVQYEEKEEPWKGKLAVFYLPERKDFSSFMRLVVGQRPDGTVHIAIRGDEPFVVCGTELGAKATDAEITSELAPLVAGALLQSKAGPSANIPGWVRYGFGRAVAARAGGVNGRQFLAYKSAARAAVLGGGGKPQAPIADVWGSDRPDGGVLAASLMDFLAFGPGAKSFPMFVSGLRADENGNEPAITAVIEGAGWKTPAELELAWKKWVQAGMPVK